MIALLVLTDGRRECIERSIPAALEQLAGPITLRVIHDDSADPDYRAWLEERFGPLGFEIIGSAERLGFGGAIRNAWRELRRRDGIRFVFHLEDDFILRRPVDLMTMSMVLNRDPKLRQLALRRQPWNDEERAAGGVIEQHPDDFREFTDGYAVWLEHRRFFTTNPSLYSTALLQREWPNGANSEGRFGVVLFAGDPAARCAFWGSRDSGEWVEHIGHQRVGSGY